MKSIILIVPINFAAIGGFCQNTLSTVPEQSEIFTPFFVLTPAGCKVPYRPMEYGKPAFSYRQQDAIKGLKYALIERIELVYPGYLSYIISIFKC